jgi:hypothetical protein
VDTLLALFYATPYFAFFCATFTVGVSSLVMIYCVHGGGEGAHEEPGLGGVPTTPQGGGGGGGHSVVVVEGGIDGALAVRRGDGEAAAVAAAAARAVSVAQRREGLLFAVATATTGSITITLSKLRCRPTNPSTPLPRGRSLRLLHLRLRPSRGRPACGVSSGLTAAVRARDRSMLLLRESFARENQVRGVVGTSCSKTVGWAGGSSLRCVFILATTLIEGSDGPGQFTGKRPAAFVFVGGLAACAVLQLKVR